MNGFEKFKIEKIVNKGEYNYAVVYNHPNRTKDNYVLHHRVVVENHIGRVLDKNEVVHHKDGNKKNNTVENLEILSASEHGFLHQKEKGREFTKLKCPECNLIFERERRQTHQSKGGLFTCCSATCRGKFSRKIQLNGVTEEIESKMKDNVIQNFKIYKYK